MLAAAIEDLFQGDPEKVKIETSLTGLKRIFAIIDVITLQFLQAPDVNR